MLRDKGKVRAAAKKTRMKKLEKKPREALKTLSPGAIMTPNSIQNSYFSLELECYWSKEMTKSIVLFIFSSQDIVRRNKTEVLNPKTKCK